MSGERLLAHLAHVRPLARVDALVVFEMRRLGELHAAHVATVRFFPGVDSRVVFEIGGLGEG